MRSVTAHCHCCHSSRPASRSRGWPGPPRGVAHLGRPAAAPASGLRGWLDSGASRLPLRPSSAGRWAACQAERPSSAAAGTTNGLRLHPETWEPPRRRRSAAAPGSAGDAIRSVTTRCHCSRPASRRQGWPGPLPWAVPLLNLRRPRLLVFESYPDRGASRWSRRALLRGVCGLPSRTTQLSSRGRTGGLPNPRTNEAGRVCCSAWFGVCASLVQARHIPVDAQTSSVFVEPLFHFGD